MPLTPADVHAVTFKKSPIGKRGYDEDEVDAFLDEVEREFARLIEENNDLRAQLGRPRADDEAGSRAPDVAEVSAEVAAVSPEADATSGPSDSEQRLTRENAELTTRLGELEQQLREAQDAAAAVPSDSEQALSVLMTAQRTANEHVGDARREADKMLLDARAKADELSRSAKATADALEKDARDKHQQAMGGLELKSKTLEKHIEGLKAFEREYRSRLKSYLESQLRDLDGKSAALDVDGRPGAGAPQPVGQTGAGSSDAQ